MESQHLDTILIVMVAIYGVSVLLHVLVLLGLALGVGKAIKAARQYADEMNTKLQPILHSTHEILEQTKGIVSRLEPKLDAAATDLADITRTAREESARLSASMEEISERVRRQAERMEHMSNSAMDGVEKAGHVLNVVANAPVKQVSGFIAAARAIVDTLRKPTTPRRGRPDGSPDREEEIRRERQQYV